MNTIATKKIALATLAAPVLAALAIGMAGAAHADNETANHRVNNRVNSYTGQQTAIAAYTDVPDAIRVGGLGCAIRGDLPIAPVGGGKYGAGPRSSDTGTTATTKPGVTAGAVSATSATHSDRMIINTRLLTQRIADSIELPAGHLGLAHSNDGKADRLIG